MKKILLPLFLTALCLTGCTFTEEEKGPTYHTFNEEVVNEDDKLVFNVTQMSVHGIVYPGTKDLRPIEFYVTVNNNNPSGNVYFSLSNYEWLLYVGEFTYVCNEVNGTKTIEPGGKGIVRPWFDVPDNVYQNNTEVKLKMNRPYRSLTDTVKYEIWWKFNLNHDVGE